MVGWQSVHSSQANSRGKPFHAVDGNVASCFTVKRQKVSSFGGKNPFQLYPAYQVDHLALLVVKFSIFVITLLDVKKPPIFWPCGLSKEAQKVLQSPAVTSCLIYAVSLHEPPPPFHKINSVVYYYP